MTGTETEITLKAHWNIKSGYGLTKYDINNYYIHIIHKGTLSKTENKVERSKIYEIDSSTTISGKKYYQIKGSNQHIPEEAFKEINVN